MFMKRKLNKITDDYSLYVSACISLGEKYKESEINLKFISKSQSKTE